MTDRAARWFAGFLLIVHGVLAAVAVVGLVEWFVPASPWPPISNPRFSAPVLLVEWLLLLAAAGIFILGYVRRWRHTPRSMVAAYASLAMLCAVQTLWLLDHDSRFQEMAIEYAEYTLILVFLFRAKYMQQRFHGTEEAMP